MKLNQRKKNLMNVKQTQSYIILILGVKYTSYNRSNNFRWNWTGGEVDMTETKECM